MITVKAFDILSPRMKNLRLVNSDRRLGLPFYQDSRGHKDSGLAGAWFKWRPVNFSKAAD